MRRNCLVGRWVPSPPPILFAVAVSLVFLANNALAQKKPKPNKKTDGPSAAATWTDPTDKEKSDKGPYTPHKEESGEPAPEPKSAHAADKGRKRDKIQAFGQIVIGFGRAPLNHPDYSPGNKGTAIGFQLGGRYDITPAFSGGLRIPITTVSVKQTNGTNLSSTVFGAPELMGEYRLSLSRLTSIPIAFGVGIPVAQGSADATGTDRDAQTKGYANQLADATTGWRDSELFQPKHLPIVVGAGIHHDRHDFELHADAKFVLLPALSTKVQTPGSLDQANPGNYKINAFAMREVTTLGGSYNFLSNPLIYAGLDLAIIWSPIQSFVFNATPAAAKPTTVQAVLEPRIGARFGAISPSVGYIAPLGGRLGGADDGGVRLRVDAFF
jgi:hypothetical protein